MAGLTDEQMAAMEAPAAQKQGLTDEEMAAHEAPSPSPVGDTLKQMLGGMSTYRHGLIRKATGGLIDQKGPLDAEHPVLNSVGEAAGAGGVGAAMGMGAGAIAPAASGVVPALGRIGLNAGAGAATGAYTAKPGQRLEGAESGAKWGGAVSALGELLSPVSKLGEWAGRSLARMTKGQGDAYLENPTDTKAIASQLEEQTPELQDRAINAIQNSRRALRAKGLEGAGKVSAALEGKSLPVSPDKYLGIDPEADSLLNEAVRQKNAGTMYSREDVNPDSVDLPANDVNRLKRLFQKQADFAQGSVTDPVQQARAPGIAQKAAGLRSQIEQAAPEVADLNKDMQNGLMLQEGLRRGLKAPLAHVSTQSPDRIAILSRLEDAGAGGVLDFGNKLGAAKTMTTPDVGSGVPTFGVKAAGRGLLGASRSVGDGAKSIQAVSGLAGLLSLLRDLK